MTNNRGEEKKTMQAIHGKITPATVAAHNAKYDADEVDMQISQAIEQIDDITQLPLAQQVAVYEEVLAKIKQYFAITKE